MVTAEGRAPVGGEGQVAHADATPRAADQRVVELPVRLNLAAQLNCFEVAVRICLRCGGCVAALLAGLHPAQPERHRLIPPAQESVYMETGAMVLTLT